MSRLDGPGVIDAGVRTIARLGQHPAVAIRVGEPGEVARPRILDQTRKGDSELRLLPIGGVDVIAPEHESAYAARRHDRTGGVMGDAEVALALPEGVQQPRPDNSFGSGHALRVEITT